MEELALRLGDIGHEITMATVHKLETGQMGLTLDYIKAFAQALQVSPEDIIADTPVPATRRIPMLGAISAGNWRDAVEYCDDYIVVPNEAGGPRAFALKPVGDSMDKLVTEDGFIVVDPDQMELWDGRCYAVRNDSGEATFKKFIALPPRLEPCSNNPDHQPIPLGREPFTIVGRVTYIGSFV